MRPIALLSLTCGAICASEVMDPPCVLGRYSHRYYHGAAGAVIDVLTIEAERIIAPEWTRKHPIAAQVIAGFVVGSAAVGKELVDHRYGSESWSHSYGDIAVTTAGGAAAGIGFTYAFRW